MRSRETLTVLSFLISALGAVVTITAIFSTDGEGPFQYMSIRGESVEVYGIGVYQHMPADVAIQGITQDYITLFLAIPLLLISLLFHRRGSLVGRIVMAGLLLYFTVTYMIYLAMGMYNEMFLLYVVILACSIIALIWSLASFDYKRMAGSCRPPSWTVPFIPMNYITSPP